MTKTIKERVLYAATKEKTITSATLRRRMRIPRTEMSNEYFNNTVMRTVRAAAQDGFLKRVETGTYRITPKGKKAIA
jgi:hypothetical protein